MVFCIRGKCQCNTCNMNSSNSLIRFWYRMHNQFTKSSHIGPYIWYQYIYMILFFLVFFSCVTSLEFSGSWRSDSSYRDQWGHSNRRSSQWLRGSAAGGNLRHRDAFITSSDPIYRARQLGWKVSRSTYTSTHTAVCSSSYQNNPNNENLMSMKSFRNILIKIYFLFSSLMSLDLQKTVMS